MNRSRSRRQRQHKLSVTRRSPKKSSLGRLLLWLSMTSLVLILGGVSIAVYRYTLAHPQLSQVLILQDETGQQLATGVLIGPTADTPKRLVILTGKGLSLALKPEGTKYRFDQIYSQLLAIGKTDDAIVAFYSHRLGRLVDNVAVIRGWGRADQEVFWPVFQAALTSLLELDFTKFTQNLVLATAVGGAQLERAELSSWQELTGLNLAQPATLAGTRCSVAVINSTNQAGLAKQVSKLIEQNGAFVARTVSSDSTLPSSLVVIDQSQVESCLPLAKRLTNLLPEPPNVETHDLVTNQFRADIAIFLGEDVISSISGDNS